MTVRLADFLFIQFDGVKSYYINALYSELLWVECDRGYAYNHGKYIIRVEMDFESSEKPLKRISSRVAYSEKELIVYDHAGYKMHIRQNIDGAFQVLICAGYDVRAFVENFRSLIFVMLIHGGAAPIHSAIVALSEGCYLFAGWGGIGKTELIIRGLRANAIFVSDEWNILSDGMVYPVRRHIDYMFYDVIANKDLFNFIERSQAILWSKILRRGILFKAIASKLGFCRDSVSRQVDCANNKYGYPIRGATFLCRNGNESLQTCESVGGNVATLVTNNFVHEATSAIVMSGHLHEAGWSGFPDSIAFIERYYSNVSSVFEEKNIFNKIDDILGSGF